MAAHSLRFDELAVALPTHIAHPMLRQLAQRLCVYGDSHTSCDSNCNCNCDCDSDSSGHSDSGSGGHGHNDSHIHDNRHCNRHDDSRIISTGKALLDTLMADNGSDAAVLVTITDEPAPRLLLTRRASHLHSHAGEVSFPGGKREPDDAHCLMTALRESCEETALPPSQVQLLGQLPTQTSKSGLQVRPFVALVPPNLVLVPELGEIARIFWADFAMLVSQPTVEYVLDYPVAGKSYQLVTPSWQVQGETVWGLTGRIIASLLEIGFDRQIEWYYRPVGSTASLDL